MLQSSILANILPDSRLADPKGTVMVDWQNTDGTFIRLELEPIYCFNCGKSNGYVPRDIMSFVSWLCMSCSEKWGEYADSWIVSDEIFWNDVAVEMLTRFGHILTHEELWSLGEQGRLGTALELLTRESPYAI